MKNLYCFCKTTILLTLLFCGNLIKAQDCAEIVIPSLPYSETNNNCGYGSNLDWDNVCFMWAITAEDVIYSFTTTDEECLNIELSGFPEGAAQMMVTDGCPMDGSSNCTSSVFSNWDESSMSLMLAPQPNTTYYLTITADDWIAPCMDYELNITTECPEATPGDCAGALVICDGYYQEEFGPADNGNYPDILPDNGCLMSNVANEGWYTLTVQESGILNFTLSPNETEDYDWALFNITDANCSQIATNPELLVSCNTYGLIGVNGSTGISTVLGGVGDANGPGDLEGPPFNADLQVQAGETYVLLVSNWTATTNGYELDFGASTAEFYDDQLPELVEAYADCSGLHVSFSEYMDCATAIPANFTCTGPEGTVTATSVTSPCSAGAAYGINFTVSFPVDFTVPGDYAVVFNAGGLADMCGNLLDPVEMAFSPATSLQLQVQEFPASCGTDNGTLEVSVTSGGQAPFVYSLDGQPGQSTGTFDDLAPGSYTITVTDQNGCSSTAAGEVILEIAEFTAGDDAFSCNYTMQTQATVPDGFTGTWQLPAGLTAADPGDPTTTISATQPGTYVASWSVSNNINCTVQDVVNLTFESLSAENLTLTPIGCHNACDGTAEIMIGGAANPATATTAWSGGNSTSAEPTLATELCAGTYTVTITSENGCSTQLPFIMVEPPALEINSVVVQPESCPGMCDAVIEIDGEANHYSIDGGLNYGPEKVFGGLCPGTYNISLKGINDCTRDTLAVIVPATGPEAKFKAVEQEVSSYNGVFKFLNRSKGHTGSSWEFGFPQSFLYSESEEPVFQLANPQVGSYGVLLVVRDGNNCLDSLLQTVKIYEEERVFIPNSFSPNEDGINDIFKPVLANIDPSDYYLQIFNRWGQMLFETDNIDEGWNGSHRETGFYVPNGMYMYRIRIKPTHAEDPEILNGSVMVIR